jgi:hypothetical protein
MACRVQPWTKECAEPDATIPRHRGMIDPEKGGNHAF